MVYFLSVGACCNDLSVHCLHGSAVQNNVAKQTCCLMFQIELCLNNSVIQLNALKFGIHLPYPDINQ